MSTSTIDRRIYFYRINCGSDDGKPRPFDPKPVLREVMEAADRRMYDGSGPDRFGWVDSLGRHPSMRLANVRHSSLPEVEEDGRLSPLPLNAGQGLAETIHVVFFPNNVIGSDFNFYGPRVSALARYLFNKSDSCPRIAFERLLRNDVADRLERLEYVSMMRLKARPSYAQAIARASEDVGAMFSAAGEIGNAYDVEIMVRTAPRSKKPLGGLRKAAARLLNLRDLRENVDKLDVRGYVPEERRMDDLDLLSDALVHKAAMVAIDKRSRAVTRESAYQAIRSAHAMLERQIEAAASVF